MVETTSRELLLLPPLKSQIGAKGGFVLTRKYIEGAAEFAHNWPGPVSSLLKLNDYRSTDMDHAEFFSDPPSVRLEVRPKSDDALAARLRHAATVLAFLSTSEAQLSALCRKLGVPLVFWAEYSPTTERQIVDAETSNPLLRLRRRLWLRRATARRRIMVRQAAGLQCSGTPAHGAYGLENANSMLFFDNRVRAAETISDAALKEKAAQIAAGQPLRLVFGGRLIEMKGVMKLPSLAAELTRQGVPFTMDIYGSGPLEEALRARITEQGLGDRVRMQNARDFRTGWIPVLLQKTDLFICPHPQGDPSSTYPEAMACGTAIVGYANEAFRGIVRVSGCGWTVPMDDIRALARTIDMLHRDRSALIGAVRTARDFARDHNFEATFARRTEHLVAASRLPEAEGKAPVQQTRCSDLTSGGSDRD